MLHHLSNLALRLGVIFGLVAAFLTTGLIATPPVTRAAPEATIIIQSAADDGTATASNCPGTGCRLRDAIAQAVSGDTLVFAGDYTINLVGSELVINMNLTIDGAGHTIIINGPGASCTTCFRVFNIAGGSTVTLNQLNINNGKTTANFGGGLINAGTLTVSNSTFSGNSATWGGGIENSGTLFITGSTFTANTATSGGAGLEAFGGTVWITNSTFVNNIADNGGGIGSGAGLQLDAGTLDLANVTIANNQAKGAADDGGGGLMIYAGTATVSNSTIAGNTTTSATGGAGISLYFASAILSLYNTIIDNSGIDCTRASGTLTADGYNLDNDGTCDNASTSTSINLGPLANNGGSTQTLALLPNSPAIDAANSATCAAAPINNLDQRGQPRNDLQCDLGAFELEYADSPTVQRAVSSTVVTTFGPTLIGIQRAAGFTDPGIITVTKYSGNTHGAGAIGATWNITPTTTSGFSLMLKLCYTLSELGSLTESNLRLWRYNGSTWVQVGGVPALSTVGNNHCAQFSGITEGGVWTLATNTPTAVILNYFTVTQADDHNTLAWETVSELHNLGFNVWRSTALGVSPTKLNTNLIPSQAPGGTDGFSYTYNDLTIVRGTGYYYWLEDMDLNGTTTWHGPAMTTTSNNPTAVQFTHFTATAAPATAIWLLWGAGLLAMAGAAVWVLRRR